MIRATYYDGKTAKSHSVYLEYTETTLNVYDFVEQVLLSTWPMAEIEAEQNGNEPPRLKRNTTPERLVVKATDDAGAMLEWVQPEIKRKKKQRNKRALFALGGIWAIAFLLWFSFPHLIDFATYCVPRSWEEQTGAEAREGIGKILSIKIKELDLETLQSEVPWIKDGEGYAGFTEIVNKLAAADENNDYEFKVSLLKSDIINAFALPGGYIIVTDSLVRHCETPDELAAVIAHEMAHVTQRHNTKQLVRMEVMTFLTSLFTGSNGMANNIGSAGTYLLSTKFSREAESEADRLGLQRLNKAAINPEALGSFFERLTPDDDDGHDYFSYLSTHPPLKERIIIAAAQNQAGFTYRPALERQKWRALKNLVGLRLKVKSTPTK